MPENMPAPELSPEEKLRAEAFGIHEEVNHGGSEG